jgi:intracellular multiplication protein IcmP
MAQQQQSNADNSLAPVWIMVLLFVTAYIAWYAGHKYIVSFIFQVNLLQAKLVNLFIGSEILTKEIYLMETVDPSSVSWQQLIILTRSVGDYIRYPVTVLLAISAFFLYKSDITMKFRKIYSMNSLCAQESKNWPAIKPVVKYDLVKQDINEGPWAMAQTPMEFAKKNNLLKKDDVILDSPQPGLEMTAGLRKGDAKRVFTLQLGAYWEGFDRLTPYAFAIATVCCARINRDRDGADLILSTIDNTFSEGKPDFSVARPILTKHINSELVQRAVNSHAYVYTVIASLLQSARDDGVVASSEFLWLKLVDRRMWYTLNCVGRQTPYSEVAGIVAHWKAELVMGRRSMVPMIDEAIKALEMAMKEVKLSPKELEELKP